MAWMTLMTSVIISLPYPINLPSTVIWKENSSNHLFFPAMFTRFYITVNSATVYVFSSILVYIQDHLSTNSPPPHFSFRSHTVLHMLRLSIFYFSLHHHNTLPTQPLQHPFDFYSHRSTITTFHHPNLLYLTSL